MPALVLDELMERDPFSLRQGEKERLYERAMYRLTTHHYENCGPYRKVLDTLGHRLEPTTALEDYPFLPVRVFKNNDLKSIEDASVVKKMTSSGTSGQNLSRIYLDKANSSNQTKVLAKIVASYLGKSRLPMLVIDSASTVKDRRMFSARGAGILGFSIFGRNPAFALDDRECIDWNAVQTFFRRHGDEPVLLFGFTYIIWERFLSELRSAGEKLDFRNAILIHGGGWKKLSHLGIGSAQFREELRELTGARRVYDYYGMVEQTGSIFMECDNGHLHCSIFSDIIVRDFLTLKPAPMGVQGLIQPISLVATSYPGHSILTEDIGEIIGSDNCPCGRKGKYFRVHGRIPNSEARGCSDTYESRK